MSSEGERRLAAIMFTDMVGYTALGQRNESLSVALVEEHRKLVRPILSRHGGREVKTMGDAFLVEFSNALDATRCAYDIQRAIHEYNFSVSDDYRIHLRVGVHLGDILESAGDVYGDAVNVASRVEPLAEDGGVCITRQVYEQVQNKFALPLASLGLKPLKNVSVPVEVYKVVMPWERKEGIPPQESRLNRIAVLPFSNMSPDPNDGYFADGMTEELIDRLAQVKGLKVIARTSVMKYKGSQKGASEVGNELGVGDLIEGSIRKAGNRVRVTVQLIRADSEEHLWSSHYDKDLDDIFAVQSEIAERVAEELKGHVLESEKKTLEKKPTENTEAYSLFLRGRELLREEAEAQVRQAQILFEKAITLDPSFAKAHVAVAQCHQFLVNSGYEPWDYSIAETRRCLDRALELDTNSPEAHATLSMLYYNIDDDEGFEREARRALELNPNLPEPYWLLFELAGLRGETEEMVNYAETAYRLDPVRPRGVSTVLSAYFWTGREAEAQGLCEKAEPLAPGPVYMFKAEYSLLKGDVVRAKEYMEKAERLIPSSTRLFGVKGAIAAKAGDHDGALAVVREIESKMGSGMGPVGYNYMAYIYNALGDANSFYDCMNKAIDLHADTPSAIMYSPLLAKAREDPRYPGLLARLRR